MAAPDRKRRNVHQIVQMFANLGLAVCDDEEAIRAKRDEQRGTRNRELNSTKGTVVAKAQQWFDDVNALLNHRDELLETLYEDFALLGDALLRADLDGGRTTLGTDTQSSLRDIAMSWCRVRPDLAAAWVARFLSERHLAEGAEIEKPLLVDDFKLRRKGARVQLTWHLPRERCDAVLLVRQSDPPPSDGGEEVVYQGRDGSFVDGRTNPAQQYLYRAFSVLDGRRSLTSRTASTRDVKRAAVPGKALAIAAGVIVVVLGGVVFQNLDGVRALMPSLPTAEQIGAALQGAPAAAAPAEPPPPPTAAAPREAGHASPQPAAASDAAAAPDSTASSTPPVEPEPEESAPPPDLPPLKAGVRAPPSIALAGHSLRLDLYLSDDVRAQLLDARLEGVAVKRLELDENPPGVRFTVDPLPEGEFQGRASWRFRLATPDGRLSPVIEGSCVVLPGA